MIIGAMAVVRWAARRGAPEGSWLARMLERKPRMVVAIALAGKMARSFDRSLGRIAFAVSRAIPVKQEDYGNPMTAVWPGPQASVRRGV